MKLILPFKTGEILSFLGVDKIKQDKRKIRIYSKSLNIAFKLKDVDLNTATVERETPIISYGT